MILFQLLILEWLMSLREVSEWGQVWKLDLDPRSLVSDVTW